MGTKLTLDIDDDLFDVVKVKSILGISGGCFCCGEQVHIDFELLDVLPISKVGTNAYHLLVCDDCERDVTFLYDSGFKDVSYVQLQNVLKELKKKKVSQKGRDALLIKLYNKYEKGI